MSLFMFPLSRHFICFYFSLIFCSRFFIILLQLASKFQHAAFIFILFTRNFLVYNICSKLILFIFLLSTSIYLRFDVFNINVWIYPVQCVDEFNSDQFRQNETHIPIFNINIFFWIFFFSVFIVSGQQNRWNTYLWNFTWNPVYGYVYTMFESFDAISQRIKYNHFQCL